MGVPKWNIQNGGIRNVPVRANSMCDIRSSYSNHVLPGSDQCESSKMSHKIQEANKNVANVLGN